MGNDGTARFRQNEALGQWPREGRPSQDDPLAELARLIGQEDPFAEFFGEIKSGSGRPAAGAAVQDDVVQERAPAARSTQPPAPSQFGPAPDYTYAPSTASPPDPVLPVRKPLIAPGASFARPASPPPEREPIAVAREPFPQPSRARLGYPLDTPQSSDEPTPSRPRALDRGNEPRLADRAAEAVAEALRIPLESRQPARSYAPVPPAAAPVVPPAAPAAPSRPAPVDEVEDDGFDDAPAPSWLTSRPAPRSPAASDNAIPERSVVETPPSFNINETAYDYGRTAYERDEDEDAGERDLRDDEQYEEYEVDEEQEEARVSRARKSLFLALVLLGIGVLGASGFYAYRALTGSVSTAEGDPPVIRADQGPSKVAAPASGNASGTDNQKMIYDRVGDAPVSGNERVVSREEQPVDVNQAAQPQPRIITPSAGNSPAPSPLPPAQLGPMQNGSPASAAPGAPAAAPAPTNGADPKRVRTVTVRADGTIVTEPAAPEAPVARPSTTMPLPGVPAASAARPAGNPMAPASTAAAPTSLGSYGSAQSNPAAPSAAAPAPAAPSNVPLPPARTSVAPPAAPAPTPVAPAAPVVAAAPAASSANGGGYFVQVAAQRSEAEAQAAWRATQSRYSGLLGSYRATIRRADLGSRGIYYRAQVGPFSNKDAAAELCQSLRAQGGDCVVQRN